jgi:YHS domain-containing protein
MRLLILAALIYLGYRALKSRIGSGHSNAETDLQNMDDEMIQDPFCGAYFPRKNAFRASVGKKDFLFCSEQCRDAYLSGREKH